MIVVGVLGAVMMKLLALIEGACSDGGNTLTRPAPSRRELAVLSAVGAIAFFGVWHLVASSGLMTKLVLPSPLDVITSCLA